jgi:transcriptional regulator with XRE-family HTH domain
MDRPSIDNMLPLKLISPFDIKEGLRTRARQRRLDANLTQEGLANRANVSFGTLKHFEKTGDASIETLIAIAFALNAEGEFDGLFPPRPYRTIDDVIEKPQRQRGRNK